jgi:hypothetical protein
LVHDGDLHIDGDLDIGTTLKAHTLFVLGNLSVSGSFSDSDDPKTVVHVAGSLSAASMVTAGFLDVRDDLRIVGALLGDYNDCNAEIGGSVYCDVFFPEEHFFTIGGSLNARVGLGNIKHRVNCKGSKPEGIPMDSPALLEHVDAELLRVCEDEDDDGNPVLSPDGFKDYRLVKNRVRDGQPLKARSQ